MNKLNNDLIKKTKKFFREEKILTVNQIALALKSSVVSARRHMKEWETFTSYNKKGRYYTLFEVPEFDKNGLWLYNDVFFTKHRNLKQTIVCLVRKSVNGLSSKEIGEIVGLDPSSFMHHFRDVPGICREKHQNRFVYFSDETAVYTKQREKKIIATQELKRFPSDTHAIIILVQFIKHPKISIQKLSEQIFSLGVKIKPEIIECFLEHHDLIKKKTVIKQ